MPRNGSITYDELSIRTETPVHQLKSVIRMAAAHGFLSEVQPMEVSHSPFSALLAADSAFLNWARWLTNYSVPSAYRFPEATEKWGSTEQKNETAFNIAMDVQVPFFDYLKQEKAMNAMFSSYMRNVASSEATSFKHLINGFDWSSLPAGAKVVDIGGSRGHASRALAERFPGLSFVVQDLPDTIANVEASPQHRIEFMPHDFFTPQPVTDGDIYLLRMIIHDWPDESAIKILRHTKNALKKPGARVVVMDTILPQPGTISLLQERQLRVRDLTMMQVFNSKEREYDTWVDLVRESGLRIIEVHQPEGSNMGLIELGLNESASYTNGIKVTEDLSQVNAAGALHGLPNGSRAKADAGPTSAVFPLTSSPTMLSAKGFNLPVMIMGAGISGLCLAQHLNKHSVPFVVFERDPTDDYRPQGYRLKLEGDAAAALRESLSEEVYKVFESTCAESHIGETDFNPISGDCTKSRVGGGLAGGQGLRASYTVDRAVFRKTLMTGIEDKIHWGREFQSYTMHDDKTISVLFKDGSIIKGAFLVGADGTRSRIRKQLVPEQKLFDTGAMCIYGKTTMTPEFLERYPARALRWMTVCKDAAPLIQSILIGESPLTLLTEPIRFSPEMRSKSKIPLPEDYVYWVLIGRKEMFSDSAELASVLARGEAKTSVSGFDDRSSKASAAHSLALTGEWHPSFRLLFEMQDVQQASTMRVVSAPPKIPAWETARLVTLIGDAIHAMSPCGGVGANTALRDATELGRLLADMGASDESRTTAVPDGTRTAQKPIGSFSDELAIFEEGVRKRAFAGIMRSYVGSKAMFDQKAFEALEPVLDDPVP